MVKIQFARGNLASLKRSYVLSWEERRNVQRRKMVSHRDRTATEPRKMRKECFQWRAKFGATNLSITVAINSASTNFKRAPRYGPPARNDRGRLFIFVARLQINSPLPIPLRAPRPAPGRRGRQLGNFSQPPLAETYFNSSTLTGLQWSGKPGKGRGFWIKDRKIHGRSASWWKSNRAVD